MENQSTSTIDRFFCAIWILALVAKLVGSALLPLSADEAYYWVWAKNISWSYYDHPPMIAWLFAMGAPFEFLGHAVRWPAVLFGHLTPLFWYAIFQLWGTPSKIRIWLGLFLLCPLTGLGGIIVTPDLPLVTMWSASMWLLLSYFKTQDLRFAWALGASLGLGFCAKYQIVLLPLSLLPALALNEARQKLSLGFFVRVFVAGLIFCFPVLWWNFNNEWISFHFQLNHGLKSHTFRWQWPAEFLLGHLLLAFPTVWWCAWRFPKALLQRLAWFAALGPFVFFFVSSFRASSELNWPIMAYPTLFALAALNTQKKHWVPAIGFWAAITLAVPVLLFFPKQFPLHEKIAEPFRYKQLAELPRAYQPLYASSYQMASLLWYVSKSPVTKLKGVNRFDMYDLWENPLPTERFYFLRDPERPLPNELKTWQMRRMDFVAPGLELMEVSPP